MDDPVAEVRALFEAADYASLKAACEPLVARWEWADFIRRAISPAYFETSMVSPGNLLDSEPADPSNGEVAHGLTVAERMVVDRQFVVDCPDRCIETFYVHEEQSITAYEFDFNPSKALKYVWRYQQDATGRILSCIQVSANGYGVELFRYDDNGRLTRIERQGISDYDGRKIDQQQELEYEGNSIARVYSCYTDGRRTLGYEKPSKDRTLAALASSLESDLGDAIDEMLNARAPFPEVIAVYHYGAGYQNRLPPRLAFTRFGELQRLSERLSDEKKAAIWNPSLWQDHAVMALNEELASRCASASQDIWQNNLQAQATSLLMRLAAQIANRHPQLIAFVTDIESSRTIDDVRSSIPGYTRRALEERGLL